MRRMPGRLAVSSWCAQRKSANRGRLRLTGRIFVSSLPFPWIRTTDQRVVRYKCSLTWPCETQWTAGRIRYIPLLIALSFSHLSPFSHHPLPPNIIDSSPIRHLSCGRLVPDHSRIARYKSFASLTYITACLSPLAFSGFRTHPSPIPHP